MATIQDTIRRLIERLAGAAVCDDCITDRLSLSVRTQANQVTRLLPGQRGFERSKAECSLCGVTKTVVRYIK